MRTAISRQRLLVVLTAFLLVFVSFGAEAAVKTWTGNGANANWNTMANWSPAGAPAPGDDLVFPAGGLRPINSNDTAAGTSYNTISFAGPVGGYSLGGNAISLAAGLRADNSDVQNVISLNITLTAPQTFTVTGDRIQLFGTLDLGANTLTINTTTYPSVIEFDGPITGTGGLTVTGIGFVYTQGTCTYSGPTNIGGRIFGVVLGSLNTASVVTVTGFAQLQLMNNVSVGPVTVGPGASFYCGGGGISQIANVTDLTMQAGSAFTMQLYSASNYGQVNVSGTVIVGDVNLSPSMTSDYVSTLGTAFKLINKTSAGGVTGTFIWFPEGASFSANGRTYQVSYVGGDGNDVVITDALPNAVASAVPTLGGAGLAGLVALLAISALIALRRAA